MIIISRNGIFMSKIWSKNTKRVVIGYPRRSCFQVFTWLVWVSNYVSQVFSCTVICLAKVLSARIAL